LFLAFALAWATPAPAQAVTASVPVRPPSVVGVPITFEVVVVGAVGEASIRWDMGDETRTELVVGLTRQTHTYSKPGHYPVLVTVVDAQGYTSATFIHTVHQPLTPKRPSVSTDLIYDSSRSRVYNVNSDNDSITITDAVGLVKVAEVPVLKGPEALALAPDGTLWVLHRSAHAIVTVNLDTLSVENTYPLPYASQPMGLAMSPMGDAAYVSLMALGKVLKLEPTTGAVLGEVAVGTWPRGLSVSHDGRDIYVTRFISADTHGEVVKLSGDALEVAARFRLAPDTTTEDTDQKGRGLANYLFSVTISPDGLRAWVPAKKDNIFRGLLRDQQELNKDNTVRPQVSMLDLALGEDQAEPRIDLDDRNLPTQVEFSPLGDYAFVSITGSAMVEVRDGYTGGFVTALKEAGIAPRGVVLGPSNKLFVHGSLTRNLVVFDLNDILVNGDQTAKRLAEISTVQAEKLEPQVLTGKQLFFNSSDGRMSVEGYLSCASCHFDGFEDGRVWDFTNVGEGLRNSVSLLGRRGTGQGNVNWSGNLDEVQDSEHLIRNVFGGRGFMTEEAFAAGTVGTPLGDPKKGVSPELDAIAAYVESLDAVNPSPFRNSDGSLTIDGQAGRGHFKRLGCGFCHTGPDATDSERGKLHDVGTIKPSSGMRSSLPLRGIDTPTLQGVWETAPYLHDGSAATLMDVLVTANPNDQHAFISSLDERQVDELVAYVQQLDGTIDPDASVGGAGGSGAGGSGAGNAPPTKPSQPSGCVYSPSAPSSLSPVALGWLALLLLSVRSGRRRRPR